MIQQFTRFRCANAQVNQQNRTTFNRELSGLCRGCGQNWTSTHRQVCPALGKKCNHCGLLNHFAKVCRRKHYKSKNPKQNKRIKTVENSENTYQSGNQIVNFLNYNEQYNSEHDSSEDTYIAMLELIIPPQSLCETWQKQLAIKIAICSLIKAVDVLK